MIEPFKVALRLKVFYGTGKRNITILDVCSYHLPAFCLSDRIVVVFNNALDNFFIIKTDIELISDLKSEISLPITSHYTLAYI